MNFPFVIDIAIGLIFVYLTLSLLASEIQNLITTLLQWRAEHVKKSIEVLFSGSNEPTKLQEARKLANKLYGSPIIKDLNQEAVGLFSFGFRKISRALYKGYQKLTKNQDLFGEEENGKHPTSGPSYISPQDFANSLMETLQIQKLAHSLAAVRLEKFKQEELTKLIEVARQSNLNPPSQEVMKTEIKKLAKDWDQIVEEFRIEQINLEMSISNLVIKLGVLIENCEFNLSPDVLENQNLIDQFKQIRKDVFGSDLRRKLLMQKIKPRMSEVMDTIRKDTVIYQEIKKAAQDKQSPTYKGIESLINELHTSLPDSVKNSISTLAKKVQDESDDTKDEFSQLQKQIENWFDRSMDRAAGVNKRNARGVTILISVLLAVCSNTDTFNMVRSLSKDSVLRATITSYAEKSVNRNDFELNIDGGMNDNSQPAPDDFDKMQEKVSVALDKVSLPIGWDETNIKQQSKEEWYVPFIKLNNENVRIPYLKRVIGWLISGMAISMGSSFWFDLLSKIINIKNIGKTSSGQNQ